MVWQIPTDGRPKLLRAVRKFFVSNGWTVTEVADTRIDFLVANGDMLYFLTVVDEEQKQYFRYEKMIEGMTHDTLEIKGFKRRTLIYILNFRFPSLPFDVLAMRGVAAFALDEMEIVTGTARYQDELPPVLGEREMLLLTGNAKVCILISQKFKQLGDRAAAIRWAEQAIKMRGGVSVAHTMLFHLYVEENDLVNAQRIGEEVFFFQPTNEHFLKLMEKLATKRNDSEAAATYSKRRSSLRQEDIPPRSFDDLIKKQREKRDASGVSVTRPPLVEPKKNGFAQLLDRFRRH